MLKICGSAIAATVLGLTVLTLTARADVASATKNLPPGVNAILTVNVQKLIASPLGKTSELQSRLMTGYADRPLAVSATSKRVTTAAAVHPMGMESMYQIAVVELVGTPRLDSIVKAQGGFLDNVANHHAAWSKRDAYFVMLDEHTYGVVSPGQRQYVSRWASGKSDTKLSPYLATAMSKAEDADAVFAVDLDNSVSTASVRYALSMGELPTLEKMEAAQSPLVAAIATVRGMTITMRATESLEAEWVIDFGSNVEALGAQAKPFVIDVLNAAGLGDNTADQWNFEAKGTRIVGKGTMQLEGLARLMALLAPTDVVAAADEAPKTDGGKPAAAPTAAEASQKYYRAISKSLENISMKASPTAGATWLMAQSKMIRQMPILNVDPDLIQFGELTADAYMRAAQELAVGQHQAKLSASNVGTPTASTTTDESGNSTGVDTADSRAAFRAAAEQRRSAAQGQRQVSAERALGMLTPLLNTRSQIRTTMTQKYGVEF